MMRFAKTGLVLLVFFLCLFPQVFGQSPAEKFAAYPSFEEVYTHFHLRFSNPDSKSEHFFEKRPEGYFVGLRDYQSREVIEKPRLYWSAAEQSYGTQPAKEVNEMEDVKAEFRRWGFEARQFDKHPYYGYLEWADDVVKELEEEEKLPDHLLNGLGRAYSHRAGLLLHDRTGVVGTDEVKEFLSTFNTKAFSNSSLDAFEENTERAVETFQRLDKQNPGYPVIVGTPRIKWANECMTAFLDLKMVQQEKRARKFLKPDIYPGIYLSMARNILSSCPPRSILFTNGDNDTYPLIYVQETDNFRPDVTIVNFSLLNSPSYLNYLMNIVPAKDRLPLGLSFDQYKLESMGAITSVKKGSSKPAEEALRDLDKELARGKEGEFPETVEFATSKELDFKPMPGAKRVEQIRFGATQYGNASVWFRSQLFLVDLLSSNQFELPICFTWIDQSQIDLLSDVLWNQGLVSQVLPFAPEPEHPRFQIAMPGYPHMDVESTTRHLVHSFDYLGLKTWATQVPLNSIRLRNSLRLVFVQLFYTLRQSREFDSAPELVTLYLRHFFKSGERFEEFNLVVGEYAYDAGMVDEAEQIANSLFADVNRLAIEMLSGEVLEARMMDKVRFVLEGLPALFENLGNNGRAQQTRDLQLKVNDLFE